MDPTTMKLVEGSVADRAVCPLKMILLENWGVGLGVEIRTDNDRHKL